MEFIGLLNDFLRVCELGIFVDLILAKTLQKSKKRIRNLVTTAQ